MLAMAAGMWLPGLSGLTGAIALLGTLSYILFFAVGAGPVPGLLIPEITSSRIRGGWQGGRGDWGLWWVLGSGRGGKKVGGKLH